MTLVRAALDAVEPRQAVHAFVRRHGDSLFVDNQEYDLKRYKHLFVVGGGKAGAPMAQALGEILGDRLTAGRINVKRGYARGYARMSACAAPLPSALTLCEAGHPIPDQEGQQSTAQMLELVREAGQDDLIFCLISGGGSALMPAPVPGISLTDLQILTEAMLRCGATINEINTVRKHCSQVQGGQLARAAAPATLVALILSDVVGSPLEIIASGPTVPDPSTFDDAYAVLKKYNLFDQIPSSIVEHIAAGRRGEVAETPKPDDPFLARVQNVIIGSNALAARAAQTQAEALGFQTLILSTYIEGEAREVGRVMAGIAKSIVAEGWPLPPPACVIAGGETTVTLRGNGLGGRNQELALAAALALDGWTGITLATLATDGGDGPTDAAGAIVDGHTVRRAHALGLSAHDSLMCNDAYRFFDALGDLIRTGPTNTNVNDLLFILADRT